MPRGDLPELGVEEFRTAVAAAVESGSRLLALHGEPARGSTLRLLAVLGDGKAGLLRLLTTAVSERYAALTPDCAQAHWFEREIREQWGVEPHGHPWLKPLRFHPPYRAATAPLPTVAPGVFDAFRVEGKDVHEVAVGPVHAGVIEPGHFRFQCHGEEVLHLEISLGYQHRGIERALVGGPTRRSIHLAETAAGDTTVGHAVAYCQALEALAGTVISPRAEALRGVGLELERLANHTGDLGALAGDVGYLPTAAFCGRIRGDFLNLTALICGSRFGRGLVRPGGVGFDIEPERARTLLGRLDAAVRDVSEAVDLLWREPSVQARFEDTGRVPPETAEALGLVGVVARACGLERDARQEFPSGIYRFSHIPVATWHTGDVFSRAYVRGLEVLRSAAFVREELEALADEPRQVPLGPLARDSIVVSVVEGWRGEICHVVSTGGDGRFLQYKVIDPSFHNWMGLAVALRGEQISDFPLCNKSFNLSYCGHDL